MSSLCGLDILLYIARHRPPMSRLASFNDAVLLLEPGEGLDSVLGKAMSMNLLGEFWC